MVWMQGGTSFTNRAGTSTGTATQDMPPSDVVLAFANGWVQTPSAQWPQLLNVPEFGVSTQAGSLYSLKLFQTGIPMVTPGTGSMANNGAITQTTALPTGFMNGPMYVNLPAGAIVAAGAAGWYYCLMSSTTAGVCYNNLYTVGQPFIPGAAVLTPFVTTGPGAYTGVTTAQTALSFTLPANLMGPNGIMEISILIGYHGSTSNKTTTIKVGASTIFSHVEATAANLAYQGYVTWGNQGATNAQFAQTVGATGVSTVAQTYSAIDTTVNQTITVINTMALATDWISIDSFSAVVTPG